MADLQHYVTVETPGGNGRGGRRIAPWIAAGVAIVVFALFIVLMTADTGRQESAASPLIGNVAPDSHGELEDGTPFDLSRRKGSWVVLNFFTSTCVPCQQEHPDLVRFNDQQATLGGDGAELYTIVYDDDREAVEAFFTDNGGDWPVVYDDDGSIAVAFGVSQVPETWIVDPTGVVRGRIISRVTADFLGTEIQRLKEQLG